MKGLSIIFLCFFMLSLRSYSQVNLYTFSQSLVTYNEITGGTVLGNAATDEQRFVDTSFVLGDTTTTGAGLPIGFNFTYDGNVFDVFAVNANGWISLGQSTLTPSVNMRSSNYTAPISATSPAPAILQNRISGFGRNLAAQSISELRYETIGYAPNRILVIQWKNFRRSTTSTNDSLNFQIRLNETTNTVDFIYGRMLYGGTQSTAQVGLRGESNSDFNNRATTSNWSSSTAGTNNTSTMRISGSVYPPSGLQFSFAPPVYYQYDGALTAVNLPLNPVALGSQWVAVTLKNNGTDTLRTATIEWTVNNIPQTSVSFVNTGLPQNGTFGPDTLGTYNFITPGFYTIKAWISLPNGHADENNTNDTVVKTIYAQDYVSIPFMENFDNPWINKNDTSDVPTAFWTNIPAYGNNSWRRDDDTLTAPWTQGARGAYTPGGANGTDHSARFHTWYAPNNSNGVMDIYIDFSPAGNKMLDFWYVNYSGNDSLSVYVSSNGGINFNFIAKLRTAAQWKRYIINLGNNTAPNTVIRFKAVSDYGNDDIGLDEVNVYMQPAGDMAAIGWISPLSGCGLSSNEHVTVKVKNEGTAPQSNIPVHYSIDGGTSWVGPETIPGPVAPGDTAVYTFLAISDFSVAGSYFCKVAVNLNGDPIAINDTAYARVISSSVISSFPFVENFNTAYSNFLMISANADAAVYYDTIGTQSTFGLRFTGKTANLWNTGTTTPSMAWSLTTHHANAITCEVDASSMTQLNMKLDLKETSSSNTNFTYTWFAVIINNTDTISDINGTRFFNPASSSDDFATKYFNLSAYAGTDFTVKFLSSCRRDAANSTNQIGDNVFIDNWAIYEPISIYDLGNDTVICQGRSVTLDAGPGAGYTYVWTRQPSTDTLGTGRTFSANSSGTYNVLVTNAMGLTASDHITITVNQPPTVNAGADTVVQYLTPAYLHGSAYPSGSYTFLWTPSNLFQNPALQNALTDSMTVSTIFTLYVTGVAGCTGSDHVIVSVAGGPLNVTAFAGPDTLCEGTYVDLLALPGGGSGNYSYDWHSSPPGFLATDASTVDLPSGNITYYVDVTDGLDTVSATVSVVVYPLPDLELGNDSILCSSASLMLDAGPAASYLWSNGDTGRLLTIDTSFTHGGAAMIWVHVENEYGCYDDDTIQVAFYPCVGISEDIKQTSVCIFPNPADGPVNIIINGLDDEAFLSLFSADGKTVYCTKIEGKTLERYSIPALAKGIYFLKVNNDKISIIHKLIMQ